MRGQVFGMMSLSLLWTVYEVLRTKYESSRIRSGFLGTPRLPVHENMCDITYSTQYKEFCCFFRERVWLHSSVNEWNGARAAALLMSDLG